MFICSQLRQNIAGNLEICLAAENLDFHRNSINSSAMSSEGQAIVWWRVRGKNGPKCELAFLGSG